MAKKLALSNGLPRMIEESSAPTIYDETLEVVSSGAGAGQINGPITAGTPVTLPSSQTYTGDELEVYLDGSRLVPVLDYTFNSSTTVAFTFELKAGDVIRFRIDRSA
jgi:hypothetical protein